MGRVSVVGIVGVPACYGGFESLVENLLPSNKIDLIYCSSRKYSTKLSECKGSRLRYLPLDANGIQSIPYDILSIFHSLFLTKNDLLVLGVSGAMAIPFFKLLSNRKVVTNIDGLEWRRDKWGRIAKSFLKFSEWVAVKYSDVVIADNAAIADYVEGEYAVSPEVIAYGGDHAIRGGLLRSDEKGDYGLALCRVEPENNVEMILKAFSESPNYKLKFIGNWKNSDFGRDLKVRYGVFANIELIDPIYDLDILFDIRSRASFYLHGHSAGGTNPSLVEMMFFDIPIYCFDCSYNRASTEDSALFFKSAEELSLMLKGGGALVSGGMAKIADQRYRWKVIREQYEALF